MHESYRSGPPNKVSSYWSPHMLPQTRAAVLQFIIFFCYEQMSNCSQNCWIDWNSVVLCFKRLVHIGVWLIVRFVQPLLAFVYGKFGPRIYMLAKHFFFKDYQKKKPVTRITQTQVSPLPSQFNVFHWKNNLYCCVVVTFMNIHV